MPTKENKDRDKRKQVQRERRSVGLPTPSDQQTRSCPPQDMESSTPIVDVGKKRGRDMKNTPLTPAGTIGSQLTSLALTPRTSRLHSASSDLASPLPKKERVFDKYPILEIQPTQDRMASVHTADDSEILLSSSDSEMSASTDSLSRTIASSGASKRGRPKKKRRGPVGQKKSTEASGSTQPKTPIYDSPMYQKHIDHKKSTGQTKTQQKTHPQTQNLDFLNTNTLEFPPGPPLKPSECTIATQNLIADRTLISQVWTVPDAWLTDEMIYTFQRYLCSIARGKKVAVLWPQYTNLDMHFGPGKIEITQEQVRTDSDYCFNYTPDYDILLITVCFLAHFGLVIFDRSNRQNPQCTFFDPKPDMDRIYDTRYPNYDPRRLKLLSDTICVLTPGLTLDDFVIRLPQLHEYTLQEDGINCGTFVSLYSEAYIVNKGSLLLLNLDINQERRRIMWHLAHLTTSNNVAYIGRKGVQLSEQALAGQEASHTDNINTEQIDFNAVEICYAKTRAPGCHIAAVADLADDRIMALWNKLSEWLDDRLIYAYLCYLASISQRNVVVVDPLVSEDTHRKFEPRRILGASFNYHQTVPTEVVVLPIHHPSHWTLVIYDREMDQAVYVNSLPHENYELSAVRIELISRIIGILTNVDSEQVFFYAVPESDRTPQPDAWSCGYFVCLFAEIWVMSSKRDFFLQNLDLSYEKRRILWHLNSLYSTDQVPYHPSKQNMPAICDTSSEFSDSSASIPSSRSSSRSVSRKRSPALPVRRSPRLSSRESSTTPSPSKSASGRTPKRNLLTKRCYVKQDHDGLPCGDVRVRHTTDYYDSGNLGDVVCDYCGALLLRSEAQKLNGKYSSAYCCHHGTVQLPAFIDHPPLLKELLSGKSKEAKEFLSHHNTYNTLLAFASVTVGYRETIHEGEVCFLLNGEFVRRIGSLLPGRNAPSFAQLYILDPATALDNRAKNVKYGGDRVDSDTLQKLDLMLRQCHPLAKTLQNFHEIYTKKLDDEGIDAVASFRLTLLEARNAPEAVQDPSLHPRQVNLPNEGDGLFAVWTETEGHPPVLKGIWITTSEGELREFPPYHPMTDCLCYPLLFPHGEDGFYRGITRVKTTRKPDEVMKPEVDDDDGQIDSDESDSSAETNDTASNTSSKRDVSNQFANYLSMRSYMRHRMAIRKDENFHHIFSAGGGLSQKFVIEYAARIDTDVANYLRRPDMDLRTTMSEDALRWLAKNAKLNSPDQLGSIVLYRAQDPGTRPFFQQKYYDATTIMSRFKKPGYASFMLTLTTNPRWPEIQRNFFHSGQRKSDRFDLLCRFFEDKHKELHRLLLHNNILGMQIAYGECREFQKRGAPHIHRVYHTNIMAIPENIENIIWAHIPPEPKKEDTSDWANFLRKVRECVFKFQLHDCGPHCLGTRGRCKKGFPKPFSTITILHDDRPATLFRPGPLDGGERVELKRGKASIFYDNSRVVAYNPYILVYLDTHHNIEFAYGQSNNLKYILWYPFKGESFAYFKAMMTPGTNNIDEPAMYARLKYRSAHEAYSRIMSHKYAYLSHFVIRMEVHLPGKQRIHFKKGEEKDVAEKIQKGLLPDTMLTAYWKQWRKQSAVKKTLFERMPEKFTFKKKKKIWKVRERQGKIIGRIYPITPRKPELFALYLMTKHMPGDPEHLKTVKLPNGTVQLCKTFIEAARLRGLLEDDDVWIRTLQEGAASLKPYQLRLLFANILIFGSTENCAIDGASLWQRFLPNFYDTRCKESEREGRIQKALAHLERILVANGKKCTDFGLTAPDLSITSDPVRGADELFFPQNAPDEDDDIKGTKEIEIYEKGNLNKGQQQFQDLISRAIGEPAFQKMYLLVGNGGTGKTYLLNYILYHLRKMVYRVICTASTGIAATRFYSGGTTVHSAFRLGIDVEPGKLPIIPLDSVHGKRIILADVILIDEVTMLHKHAFENLDLLCRQLTARDLPFGGKCVVISGDWKQGLPVVLGYGVEAQVAACIQTSELYPMFQKYKLTENMRVSEKEVEFLNWLYDIGTGALGKTVAIPKDMLVHSREELLGWVFGKGFNMPSEAILSQLLLGTTNRIVDMNNGLIMEKVEGNFADFLSADKALDENPLAVNAADYDVTQLNILTPSGMPSHHLRLKVGAVVVLLINADTSRGLCNGTRLIIKKLTPNLVEAEAITGGAPRIAGIPRVRSTFDPKRQDKVSFERFQFPLRVAFAMTITKAQGQTCTRLGIDFSEEPFAHGQLYTALSRCTSRDGIRIYAPNKKLDDKGCPLVRNVVAKGIEFD